MKLVAAYRPFIVLILIASLTWSCGKSKGELLLGVWKVTELDLSGTKLTGDQIDMTYEFDKTGNFSRSEDGKSEKGTYEINTETGVLIFKFADLDLVAEKKIEQISNDRLILSGEEFSMQQTLTMQRQ